MKQQTMIEYLNTLRLFKKLDSNYLSSIMRNSDVDFFKSGTVIMRENMPSNHKVYIILEWSAFVHMEGALVASLWKWDVFWEYAPIFQKNRTATVTASSDLTCLILVKRTVLELIAHGCGINDIVIKRINDNKKHKRWVFKNA